MSPRQPPTKTFRLATLSSVPTQSRSHLAGLRGMLGQVFFRTTQSTNAGSNLSAAAPMQLMFPDGDLKWTSFAGAAAAWSASARATTAASTPGCYAHKIASMTRPVTLFTGQWADLPLEDLAEKAGRWGFDGLELACWGDHFEVDRALAEDDYCTGIQEVLERNHLNCFALGAHLVGQAICDPIDARHQAILPPDVWGDGDPAGVQQRAAERMKDTARAAARLGVAQVNGFTGSAIWHLLYSFPPNDFAEIERGYEEFAERWSPIIDVFDAEGVKFGLEVHPTEIAYDFVTTRQTLDAIDNREGFGINLDPSHFAHQHLDTAQFALEFADRIYHVHVKDSRKRLDGRRSILGSHLNFGEEARGWDFVSPGHGDVDFEELLRALNRIGYTGPLSIEWEDSGMDREYGAQDALAFVRRTDFAPSAVAFDAAMQRS